MRRAGDILFFLASVGASVYAFHLVSVAIGLNGNAAARHYGEMLLWSRGWAAFAVLLTLVFVTTARGWWRLVAALPFASSLFVVWATIVLLPNASA